MYRLIQTSGYSEARLDHIHLLELLFPKNNPEYNNNQNIEME